MNARKRLGAILAALLLAAMGAAIAWGLYHDATTEPTIVQRGSVR